MYKNITESMLDHFRNTCQSLDSKYGTCLKCGRRVTEAVCIGDDYLCQRCSQEEFSNLIYRMSAYEIAELFGKDFMEW